MIFLIAHDRRQGRLVSLREFSDLAGDEAAETRLDLELALHRQGVEHEVVLLQAANSDALKQTHRRYFQSLTESLRDFAKSTGG